MVSPSGLAAEKYIRAGISVTPTNGKVPVLKDRTGTEVALDNIQQHLLDNDRIVIAFCSGSASEVS
jgi:hypothetical protein